MFNVRLAGDYLYRKWLFTWLSLVMFLVVFCFVPSLFPRDVLPDPVKSLTHITKNSPYSCHVEICIRNNSKILEIHIWPFHFLVYDFLISENN